MSVKCSSGADNSAHGSDLLEGSGNKAREYFILRCLFGFIAALTEARQESLLSGS